MHLHHFDQSQQTLQSAHAAFSAPIDDVHVCTAVLLLPTASRQVDGHGTVFVGVGLSSAVGTSWFGTGSLAHRGLTYSGIKIRNPDSMGGACVASVLTTGVGYDNRLTCCCLDRYACVEEALP